MDLKRTKTHVPETRPIPSWVRDIQRTYRETTDETQFFRKQQWSRVDKLVNLAGETIVYGLIMRLDETQLHSKNVQALRFACEQFCREYDRLTQRD